jgi:hypothetical protein
MRRILDGDRPWGSHEVLTDRFGVTRYRLIVYPPGISDTERRHLRLWRGWPLWGAVVWVVAEFAFSQVTGPWTALAGSAAGYAACGLSARWLAGPHRHGVRILTASVLHGHPEPVSRATARDIASLAQELIDADARRARDEISAVEHEWAWWRVYSHLAGPQRDRRESGRPRL